MKILILISVSFHVTMIVSSPMIPRTFTVSSVQVARTECPENKLKIFYISNEAEKDAAEDILEKGDVTKLWNGYYHQTQYIENMGCFNLTGSPTGPQIKDCEMDISYCWTYCNSRKPEYLFAIKKNNCICFESQATLFENSTLKQCTNKCRRNKEEFCGSESTFYNIYKTSDIETADMSSRECLLYNNNNRVSKANCRTKNDRKHDIYCKNNKTSTSRSWDKAMIYCFNRNSTLSTPSDPPMKSKYWLNERKYRPTVLISTLDNEWLTSATSTKCQYLSMKKDELEVKVDKCELLSTFACGENNDHDPYEGCRYIPEISTTTTATDNAVTSDVTSEVTTFKMLSTSEDTSVSYGDVTDVESSTLILRSLGKRASRSGLVIAAAVSCVVVVIITTAIICILIRRLRKHRGQNEQMAYSKGKNGSSKDRTITNVKYTEGDNCIIQGAVPNRKSFHEYSTIADQQEMMSKEDQTNAYHKTRSSTSAVTKTSEYHTLEETRDITSTNGDLAGSKYEDPIEIKAYRKSDQQALIGQSNEYRTLEPSTTSPKETGNSSTFSYQQAQTRSAKDRGTDKESAGNPNVVDKDYSHLHLCGDGGNNVVVDKRDSTYAHAGPDFMEEGEYAHTNHSQNLVGSNEIEIDDTYAHTGNEEGKYECLSSMHTTAL